MIANKLKAPILGSMWLPISDGSQKKAEIYDCRLLGIDLIIWHSSQGLHACLDRCPHRGARLSQGWIEKNQWLVCPYHGLAYNAKGACQKIPSQPHLTPPKQLQLKPLAVQERYGLIWVSLNTPKQNLPQIPQWDSLSYRQVLCGPYFYKANAYRVVENFLDVAHFSFIHDGILGERQSAEIEPYSVQRDREGIKATNIKVIQPNPDGTGTPHLVTYEYRVEHPLVASLSKTTTAGELMIFLAVTPIDEGQCFAWMGLGMNYGHDIPLVQLKRFQDQIVEQDIFVVESQQPQCPSKSWLDEYPLASDQLAVAYRKWLQELGVKFGLRS